MRSAAYADRVLKGEKPCELPSLSFGAGTRRAANSDQLAPTRFIEKSNTSGLGTFRTWRDARLESVVRGESDIIALCVSAKPRHEKLGPIGACFFRADLLLAPTHRLNAWLFGVFCDF
jgi:hypothetical protein